MTTGIERVRVMPTDAEGMAARAAMLWPGAPRNQREWLRAWAVLRATQRGALLDVVAPVAAMACRPVPRLDDDDTQ